MQKRAAQRNQELRNLWRAVLGTYSADQLVFLDESAANERTGDRKYGWAPPGSIAIDVKPIKRTERWSILPAYSVDGYLTWKIVKGSFTKELFNDFVVDDLLPVTHAFPGPRSVIVVDNAQIHRNEVWSPLDSTVDIQVATNQQFRS